MKERRGVEVEGGSRKGGDWLRREGGGGKNRGVGRKKAEKVKKEANWSLQKITKATYLF